MLFELGEIQKIESNIANLEQLRQSLDTKCLSAFSSQSNQVQNSLLNILKTVLTQSQITLSTLNSIEDQIQMGYFVPDSLNVDELVYDPSQLPEWFQFVFKKQYQKQKKNLDGLCKKTYKMQSLPDVKHNLEKEIQSFRLLYQRYKNLSGKEKIPLNIIGEAEVVRSKCRNCKQKFSIYCNIISSKILTFLEQSVSKSLNFSNSMNSIGSNVTNSFNVKLQPQQFQRGYLTNKFKEQTTAPSFQTSAHFRPKTTQSVDFYGKTMYNNNASSNQYKRYVPRHLYNTTVYDFYS